LGSSLLDLGGFTDFLCFFYLFFLVESELLRDFDLDLVRRLSCGV
jgi:hypothetical protein